MKQIQGDGFVVDIVRSKRRKTLALAVNQGQVKVRMPERMALHHAESFIALKSDWIKKQLAQYPAPSPRHYSNGENLLFLGQPLQLVVVSSAQATGIEKRDMKLCIQHRHATPSIAQLKKLLSNWYQQQAEEYLSLRVSQLASATGLIPRTLQIKTYKARWGSCHRDGSIQLNWKLLMAPPSIIDYVIIHELCHLKQHNHSPAFWKLVEQFHPDYRSHRAWLKSHGHQLNLS